MVSQRARMAPRSAMRKPRRITPPSSWWAFIVLGSRVTPISGVNSTATIQDTTSDTAMTTKSEKVNSPAASR